MKHILLKLIRLYQRLISPDHSLFGKARHPLGYCKFTPSCSEYLCRAIEQRGVIVGLAKGAWRVLRCNPWSRGGVDRVP